MPKWVEDSEDDRDNSLKESPFNTRSDSNSSEGGDSAKIFSSDDGILGLNEEVTEAAESYVEERVCFLARARACVSCSLRIVTSRLASVPTCDG